MAGNDEIWSAEDKRNNAVSSDKIGAVGELRTLQYVREVKAYGPTRNDAAYLYPGTEIPLKPEALAEQNSSSVVKWQPKLDTAFTATNSKIVSELYLVASISSSSSPGGTSTLIFLLPLSSRILHRIHFRANAVQLPTLRLTRTRKCLVYLIRAR